MQLFTGICVSLRSAYTCDKFHLKVPMKKKPKRTKCTSIHKYMNSMSARQILSLEIVQTLGYLRKAPKTDGLDRKAKKTRAPRGTDRSPEYNEHFCHKLDSRVKNLSTEWNQNNNTS